MTGLSGQVRIFLTRSSNSLASNKNKRKLRVSNTIANGNLPEGVLMTNIAKAIDRLREERRDAQNQVQKLGEAIAVLERLTRGGGATTLTGSSRHGRRVLSAAGRRRISLAQKARWAKMRQTKKAA
jgi:hypothetical protein